MVYVVFGTYGFRAETLLGVFAEEVNARWKAGHSTQSYDKVRLAVYDTRTGTEISSELVESA